MAQVDDEEEESKLSIIKRPGGSISDVDFRALIVPIIGNVEGNKMKFKDRFGILHIIMEETRVIVLWEGVGHEITYTDVEEEFKLLGKKHYFEKVNYVSILSENRVPVRATSFIEARVIAFNDPGLVDSDLEFVVQKKQAVYVSEYAASNGYMSIYEKMRDRELDVNFLRFDYHNVDVRAFLVNLVDFDEKRKEFSPKNANMTVVNRSDRVIITEGRLEAIFKWLKKDPELEGDSVGDTDEELRMIQKDTYDDLVLFLEGGCILFKITEER